jgi:ABC-type oligopeptide transport system substrate-binding subunit
VATSQIKQQEPQQRSKPAAVAAELVLLTVRSLLPSWQQCNFRLPRMRFTVVSAIHNPPLVMTANC